MIRGGPRMIPGRPRMISGGPRVIPGGPRMIPGGPRMIPGRARAAYDSGGSLHGDSGSFGGFQVCSCVVLEIPFFARVENRNHRNRAFLRPGNAQKLLKKCFFWNWPRFSWKKHGKGEQGSVASAEFSSAQVHPPPSPLQHATTENCNFRTFALQKLHCNIPFSAVQTSHLPEVELQRATKRTSTSTELRCKKVVFPAASCGFAVPTFRLPILVGPAVT